MYIVGLLCIFMYLLYAGQMLDFLWSLSWVVFPRVCGFLASWIVSGRVALSVGRRAVPRWRHGGVCVLTWARRTRPGRCTRLAVPLPRRGSLFYRQCGFAGGDLIHGRAMCSRGWGLPGRGTTESLGQMWCWYDNAGNTFDKFYLVCVICTCLARLRAPVFYIYM